MDNLNDYNDVDYSFYFSIIDSSACLADSTPVEIKGSHHCSYKIPLTLSFAGIPFARVNGTIKMEDPLVWKDHRLLVARCNLQKN